MYIVYKYALYQGIKHIKRHMMQAEAAQTLEMSYARESGEWMVTGTFDEEALNAQNPADPKLVEEDIGQRDWWGWVPFGWGRRKGKPGVRSAENVTYT